MFKVFNKIIKEKTPLTEEEYQKISPFILNRYLSGNRIGLVLADIFNTYPNIPMKNRVDLIREVVKNEKIKYIKYPKINKEKDKYIENISLYYNVNYELAKEYYEVMEESQAIEITNYLNDKGGKI